MINGLELYIPYNWFILICDPETNQLDWIAINECSTIECQSYLMATGDSMTRTSKIDILDVIENYTSYYPILQKTYGLCHPVSKEISRTGQEIQLSIVISPNDVSKFVIGKYAGDLM